MIDNFTWKFVTLNLSCTFNLSTDATVPPVVVALRSYRSNDVTLMVHFYYPTVLSRSFRYVQLCQSPSLSLLSWLHVFFPKGFQRWMIHCILGSKSSFWLMFSFSLSLHSHITTTAWHRDLKSNKLKSRNSKKLQRLKESKKDCQGKRMSCWMSLIPK